VLRTGSRRHRALALAPIAIALVGFFGALLTQLQAQPAGRTLPQTLSQTGLFRDLTTLTPSAGVVPYDVNVPYWMDGAVARRWIAVPGDGSSRDPRVDRIIVKPGYPWVFPTGTVFVQHVETALDARQPTVRRRLETRVLVRDNEGAVYGVSYRWNRDGTDATLDVKGGEETLTIAGADGSTRQQTWEFPSSDQCAVCHNQAANGGVLGVTYRQMNRTIRYESARFSINQVEAWNNVGMLSKSLDEPSALAIWNLARIPAAMPVRFWNVPRLGRLSAMDDSAASVEDKARSYLDANCSHCHSPGIVNADFDARSSTPLPEQRLVGTRARIPRPGLEWLIRPGHPEQSLLYARLISTDPSLRMPPFGRHSVDAAGAGLIESWIRSLPAPSSQGGQ
jgi:uncharacterized repeat protein (TIGR03806 family)